MIEGRSAVDKPRSECNHVRAQAALVLGRSRDRRAEVSGYGRRGLARYGIDHRDVHITPTDSGGARPSHREGPAVRNIGKESLMSTIVVILIVVIVVLIALGGMLYFRHQRSERLRTDFWFRV